ncbi:MAG TPA: hypothetical protein VK974_04950 [Methylophilaceae bacterium]|nr:hypothetical protein [Methylophilaceae bacterium]
MQNNRITGLFIVLAMLATGQALAEDAAPDSAGSVRESQADTNKDGKISYDEFKASHEKRLEAQFKRMDINGDGFVDEAERQTVHDKMRDMRAKRKQSAE